MISGILGILIPVGVNTCFLLLGPPNELAFASIRIVSLAIVPVFIARVAYRQGYDRGSAVLPSTSNN